MLYSPVPKNPDISHVPHKDKLELNASKRFPGGSRFPKFAEGRWLQLPGALFQAFTNALRSKIPLNATRAYCLSFGSAGSADLQGLWWDTRVPKHRSPVKPQLTTFFPLRSSASAP